MPAGTLLAVAALVVCCAACSAVQPRTANQAAVPVSRAATPVATPAATPTPVPPTPEPTPVPAAPTPTPARTFALGGSGSVTVAAAAGASSTITVMVSGLRPVAHAVHLHGGCTGSPNAHIAVIGVVGSGGTLSITVPNRLLGATVIVYPDASATGTPILCGATAA